VPTLNTIAPFFVVDDLQASLDFYCSKLGFRTTYTGGAGNGVEKDFFGIVERDRVMIMLKAITPEVHPQPNHSRHVWARWDAYVHTLDPDVLYSEYLANAVPMHSPLSDTSDGLRAFEIIDNSGYVICFGRPNKPQN
jgi:catechol 2,3-dioxygenase-like lactoylglutathione lyase family enzyme